jgi:hypothetical protein
MSESFQGARDGQVSGHLDDLLTLSEALEARVRAAQKDAEGILGCQLDIDRFEPVTVQGKWLLRVFWRKAASRH